MSEVTVSVTGSISEPAQPLTVSSTSGTLSGTVGGVAKIADASGNPLVVSGGTSPYAVAFDPTTPGPDGLEVSLDSNNQIVLTGSPVNSGEQDFSLDVTDSAVPAAKVNLKSGKAPASKRNLGSMGDS